MLTFRQPLEELTMTVICETCSDLTRASATCNVGAVKARAAEGCSSCKVLAEAVAKELPEIDDEDDLQLDTDVSLFVGVASATRKSDPYLEVFVASGMFLTTRRRLLLLTHEE